MLYSHAMVSPEVTASSSKNLEVILEHAEASVAGGAEQPTHYARLVIVVNVRVLNEPAADAARTAGGHPLAHGRRVESVHAPTSR